VVGECRSSTIPPPPVKALGLRDPSGMLHYSVACNENGTGRMEGWLKQSVAKVVAKTLSKEDLSWPVIRTTRCFQNFAFTEFRMFVFFILYFPYSIQNLTELCDFWCNKIPPNF
jgi:hypothetical protein